MMLKYNHKSEKGFALATVFLFITFFFIIGSAMIFSSKQEQPVITHIDNLTRGRYYATGFLNIIELKMKTLDAEFLEALKDDETLRKPGDPPNVSNSPLFNQFFKDFQNPSTYSQNLGIDTKEFTIKLDSVEREHLQYVDKSTATSIETYYTEILKVTVLVSWKDKTQNNKVVTDLVSKTFRFRRRYKS